MACKTAVLSPAMVPRLEKLLAQGWTRRRDSRRRELIIKSIGFNGFKSAFSFMTDVAAEAARLKHHPEWTNVYNRVDIALTTHSAGNKVTDLDVELGEGIEACLTRHPIRPSPSSPDGT